MPLKIVLGNGEKIIINGAVLENVGGPIKALVLNEAAILREKDIITETDATTPASRAYFALQNLYIFPARREDYYPFVQKLYTEYATAAPSSIEIVKDILEDVDAHNYYKALRGARKLVEHEGSVMGYVEQGINDALQQHPETGEPPADGSMGADRGSSQD